MVFRETIFFRFSRREKLSDFYLDRSRLAMIYIYIAIIRQSTHVASRNGSSLKSLEPRLWPSFRVISRGVVAPQDCSS